MATTSLKLPDDVKQLAAMAASHQGVTPHAFMVDAIRQAAVAAQKRASFVADALEARAATLRSGKAYDAQEVHAYLKGRASGKPTARPKAKSWRV